MDSYLPNTYDIFFLVLSLLPVKSLLRCMCVCKSWKYLITSSAFVTAHHRNNKKKNVKNLYLVYMRDDNYLESSSQVCTVLRRNHEPSPYSYVKHFDANLPLSQYNVVGACEGLICLTIGKTWDPNPEIYIWNPWVGTLKCIPPCETLHEDTRTGLGFGFCKDDYKIIKIHYNCRLPPCLQNQAMIYSLGTNSWRIIDCEPETEMWLFRPEAGVFFEGSIYWLSCCTRGNDEVIGVILRFDFETEIFEGVNVAPHLDHDYLVLVVTDGNLVLIQEAEPLWVVTGPAWVKKGSSWSRVNTIRITHDDDFLEILQRPDQLLMKPGKSRPYGDANMAAIQGEKTYVCDYNPNATDSWKFIEMEVSDRAERFDLVRVKESLLLLDERHKN